MLTGKRDVDFVCYLLFKNELKWRNLHLRRKTGQLRPMLATFEQGGMFIVPHLSWHGALVLTVSSERRPQILAFLLQAWSTEDLF